MVLADFARQAEAERLAARLVIEGVGAQVWPVQQAAALLPGSEPPIGPTVVVARGDHEHALTLAHLFAEVDAGVSVVASPPQDVWHGSFVRLLVGVFAVSMIVSAVVVMLFAAV